jgi:arsenate reductase (glutaredoxin)
VSFFASVIPKIINQTNLVLVVYVYKSCSSCRLATQWLAAQGIGYVERAIRDTPPSVEELRTMLGHLGGERRRLCNTAGTDYRAEQFGNRLELLSESEFLARLAANGNLVKRPFLLRTVPLLGLVGFTASAWHSAFADVLPKFLSVMD